MKIYDEVVGKVGDLAIDLGKTAVIAGIAGLFVEKIIQPVISIGTIIVGLALIFVGGPRFISRIVDKKTLTKA